ncbi:MAG: heme exporter protein CcmD [Proteobacteria bacterium]|nr:heme exporter protein CcmD [Pseudomonadota bacterium]
MNPAAIQPIDVWPFVNGAYAATVLFLAGAAWLTFARYRRARARLAQVEQV